MPPLAATPVLDFGRGPLTGDYLLRIAIAAPLRVTFGRYAGGAEVPVPAGDHLYIGSACAQCGTPALAYRVLRHLTRTPPRPAHQLYPIVAAHFAAAGAAVTPATKHLRWHIDYLLDAREAEVRAVALWRTAYSHEFDLAAILAAHPDCTPLAPGLGASDHRGASHLFVLQGGDTAWSAVIEELCAHRATPSCPDLAGARHD